jgi:hypothetical protein
VELIHEVEDGRRTQSREALDALAAAGSHSTSHASA